MTDEPVHTRATFITVQRPLLPSPPLDAEPEWCYTNTLIFHDKEGKNVWEQKIPEASLWWVESDNSNPSDVFGHYFWQLRVFKLESFGWQLEFSISHNKAMKVLAQIMEDIEHYHSAHFVASDGSP